MKRIFILAAVIVFAGCADSTKDANDAMTAEQTIASALADVDVSSLGSSSPTIKHMADVESETTDLSANNAFMQIGLQGVSKLADGDHELKMDTSDKLSLSFVGLEVGNLTMADAGMKSIASVDVDATDLGSIHSELVSEISASVKNLAEQSSSVKSGL